MMNNNEKIETVVEAPPEPEIQPKTLGEILKNIFIIYYKGFFKFVIPVAIVNGILIGIGLWMTHSKFHVHTVWPALGVLILIYLIYSVLYVLSSGILISTAASYNLSVKSSVRNSLLLLWRRLARLYGALGLLWLFGIALGVIFFIFSMMYIPGIILYCVIFIPITIFLIVKWAFIYPAVVIEGCRPGEAFSRSSELVEGYWWRTFGIILVIGLISGGIGYGLSYAFKFTHEYSELIATVISVPIGVIGNTLLYYDLRARWGDNSKETAVAELSTDVKAEN